MTTESAWDRWENLRSGPEPDPIEVLRAVGKFQEYFEAIEKEAVRVARAQGRTWQEIGSALGRTRQAIWQRVGSRPSAEALNQRWSQIKKSVDQWWAHTAEIRFETGSQP